MLSRHTPREHVNSAEPGVARRDAVLAFDFQATQEAGDAFRREVGNLEPLDGALAVARRELQQKEQRVTVATERVRAPPRCAGR